MRPGLALVLTYHSISRGAGPLRVAPERFGEQLDGLRAAGFRAVSLRALVEPAAPGDDAPRFAVTFDDGYRDFLDAALPILERRGVPATLFVTAAADRSCLPGGLDLPLLSIEALRDLARRGIGIGAHSIGHADLRRLDDRALERELADGRRVLEDWTSAKVDAFAYPYGAWDPRVRAAVVRHYALACTTRLAPVRPDADPLAIPRIDAFYLRSPLLRYLIARGRPEPYLAVRHWLRRLRGSERSQA